MTFSAHDISFMQQAIEASRAAAEAGNTPFGALLARGEEPLALAGNEQFTSVDCTAHAELVLVRKAMRRHGLPALRGTTVYASGEPCAMCAGAMFWAGVSRIVFAATTEDIHAALGDPSLPTRCAVTLAGCTPPVLVEGPLLREEAAAVLMKYGLPASVR